MLVGATVVAYDDTKNGLHPTDPVYLYVVKTSSVGAYDLSGLVVGHDYRISLAVPGKYVLSQTTTAAVSPIEDVDFTLQSKALDVDVTVRKRDADFEFIINNPADFASGEARTRSVRPGHFHRRPSDFEQLPNKQLVAHIPFAGLTAGTDYLLHIAAESYSGDTVVKEVPFSLGDQGHAEKQIDLALLGDETENSQGRAANEVLIDESGSDPSGIVIPTGGMVTSTGAASDVPQMTFSKTDREDAGVADLTGDLPTEGTLSSEIYTLELDNVNLTEKGFEVNLGFDSDADWSELAAYQYNPTTHQWELVPGVQTIDPSAGTINFNVTDLSGGAPGCSPLGPPAALAPSPTRSMRAAFNGQSHSIRIGATSGAGQFAIMKISGIAGASFSGTKFKVFNFPNPFNLKAKTVNLSNRAAPPPSPPTGPSSSSRFPPRSARATS
ncbi:MAG: hypothetical protein IPP35_12630 [Elusimicrobia bacterium]|nr:hypothetical protein [Elusimicrobiota bacterium]